MKREIYDIDGVILEEDSEKAVAKIVVNEEIGKVSYYIKFHDGGLLDPSVSNFNSRRVQREAKYRKVPTKCFMLYLRFLKTKIKTSLLQAQRAIYG